MHTNVHQRAIAPLVMYYNQQNKIVPGLCNEQDARNRESPRFTFAWSVHKIWYMIILFLWAKHWQGPRAN